VAYLSVCILYQEVQKPGTACCVGHVRFALGYGFLILIQGMSVKGFDNIVWPMGEHKYGYDLPFPPYHDIWDIAMRFPSPVDIARCTWGPSHASLK
jgi:hypothetical protein